MRRGRRLGSKRYRGIVISTEILLLLFAVLTLSAIVIFNVAKHEMAQATSEKHTLTIVRAEAWKLKRAIGVSVYLQNMGSASVRISGIGVSYYTGRSFRTCSLQIDVRISPGESVTLSKVFDYSNCDGIKAVSAGDSIYVFVYYDKGEVGTACKVVEP